MWGTCKPELLMTSQYTEGHSPEPSIPATFSICLLAAAAFCTRQQYRLCFQASKFPGKMDVFLESIWEWCTLHSCLPWREACWNINHWAEVKNFCLTEMSVLTSYRRKAHPLLPQVCEFGVRLVLDHTLWAVPSWHPCVPFSMGWLNLPCSLPLSYSSLIWTSDNISSADFVLLNKAVDGQVHYTCLEWEKSA